MVVRKSSHNLTSLLFFLESSRNIPDPVTQNSSPGSQHRMWSGPPSSLVMSSELKLPSQHVNLTHSFCKTLSNLLWEVMCVCPRMLSRSVVSDSLRSYGLCSLPGSSIHGILQARILDWVAMLSSRPRDRIHVSCLLRWQSGSLPLVSLGSPWEAVYALKGELFLIPRPPDTLHSSLVAVTGHSGCLLSSAASQVGVCTQKRVWGGHSLLKLFVSFFVCTGSWLRHAGFSVAAGGV